MTFRAALLPVVVGADREAPAGCAFRLRPPVGASRLSELRASAGLLLPPSRTLQRAGRRVREESRRQ
jgi:hypothetical protein